jgi:tetratricopeptide (TPR) repeat protein
MDRQIRNAIDAGDGDYEIQHMRQKMTANPDDLQLRLELARLYRKRGYTEVAIEHYRLAAARFPDSAEVQLELIKALRDLGLQQEGAHSLETFLRNHPQKSPELASWLGILDDECRNWTAGEQAHRAALALGPDSDYLHNNLGYNLLMQGQKDAAAAEFRRALELNPKSDLARNNLGLALASHADAALQQWSSVLDNASAHNNMAAVLIEQGNYPDARKELEIALGYNKVHSAALHNLQLVSLLDGKPATVGFQQPRSFWTKWGSAVRRAVTGPVAEDRKTASSASAGNGRGL